MPAGSRTPIPIRDVFSRVLLGFLRAGNIAKQRKPFPEQISEGPHRTTARQAGQHLGKPALAGSSPLLWWIAPSSWSAFLTARDW